MATKAATMIAMVVNFIADILNRVQPLGQVTWSQSVSHLIRRLSVANESTLDWLLYIYCHAFISFLSNMYTLADV